MLVLLEDDVCLLYHSLVEPYLNYCCMVRASDEKSCILDKILKIQKKYCRIITFSHFQAHSGPLFISLNVLTIHNLYKFQVLIYMYKNHDNMLPNAIIQFQSNAAVHSHFTRNCNKLHVVYCRTKLYQKTLAHQGPKLWNELPLHLKILPFGSFKRNLKNYLISS